MTGLPASQRSNGGFAATRLSGCGGFRGLTTLDHGYSGGRPSGAAFPLFTLTCPRGLARAARSNHGLPGGRLSGAAEVVRLIGMRSALASDIQLHLGGVGREPHPPLEAEPEFFEQPGGPVIIC